MVSVYAALRGVIALVPRKVGMTWMARSIGLSLAVGLAGCTWTSHLSPNIRLTRPPIPEKRHQQDGVTSAGGQK
jgi:hypothetical protein